jgi:hypothetical protein
MKSENLANLILSAKGRHHYSYEALAKACGDVPSAGRLHQLAKYPLKTFPDPATVLGLARGCGVPPDEVIKASARSLGINLSDGDSDLIHVPGFSDLPIQVQETYRALGHQMTSLLPDGVKSSRFRSGGPEDDARIADELNELADAATAQARVYRTEAEHHAERARR